MCCTSVDTLYVVITARVPLHMFCILFTFCYLLIYIKVHTEQKNNLQTSGFRHKYACTECEKRYTRNSHLKRRNSHLKRHMQLHTGRFSFHCETCGKGFNQGHLYKDHVRAHQGLKYNCEYCSRLFVSTQVYKKHISLHSV